jgi:chromosome segregation ATPase
VRYWRMRFWVLVLIPLGSSVSRTHAADPRPSELASRLRALTESQQGLTSEIALLREQLRQIEERLGEVREEVRRNHDADRGSREQMKEMREEVRGLYVETSGLKGDIANVGEEIRSVSRSFDNFRFSSGALLAVLIVLQVVAVALNLRRG